VDSESQLFKVLADPIRLRLAVLLAIKGEVCVCELAGALDEPQYKISRNLAIMRSNGLVEVRRNGTWMYYRLRDPASELERCLFDCFRDCLRTHAAIRADLKRFHKATCREY